jgi:hypothetical protein
MAPYLFQYDPFQHEPPSGNKFIDNEIEQQQERSATDERSNAD